jgi:hypothetical protein
MSIPEAGIAKIISLNQSVADSSGTGTSIALRRWQAERAADPNSFRSGDS